VPDYSFWLLFLKEPFPTKEPLFKLLLALTGQSPENPPCEGSRLLAIVLLLIKSFAILLKIVRQQKSAGKKLVNFSSLGGESWKTEHFFQEISEKILPKMLTFNGMLGKI